MASFIRAMAPLASGSQRDCCCTPQHSCGFTRSPTSGSVIQPWFTENGPTRRFVPSTGRILEVLVQDGKELIRRIGAHGGLISAENGFSTKDIQSQVEELRNPLLQWHGGMSKKRKKEILEGVFNGSR